MIERTAKNPASYCNFPELVAEELARVRANHAPLNSAHEGYAVILEEIDEFWDWCRLKRSQRISDDGLRELVHVAAVAQRLAEDIGLTATAATEDEKLYEMNRRAADNNDQEAP